MGFVIGLLTVVMVFDCLLLILLILIQLPKKDAGAALAFGGGTTDALFGAGSGTVLTKITKYAATGFFLLAVIVSVMVSRFRTQGISSFEKGFENPTRPSTPATRPAPSVTPNASPSAQVVSPVNPSSNLTLTLTAESTNTPASTATSNAAPVPAPK